MPNPDSAQANVMEPRVIELVATQDALDSVVDLVRATPMVAVDTEFVRETTYYAKLCLIQIATDKLVACVDCLAPLDLAPLYAEIFRDGCTWILHSARQDLEVIWQRTERMPPQLIDTQIAAALTGLTPQIGLESLLLKTLQVELGESHARTDWSRRPLPAAALKYALDDVRFLLPAWRHLQEQLGALGRLPWLEEDSRRLLGERPVADDVTIWSRLRGARTLTLAQQSAALALVRWRESTAQRLDRPRRWILADEALVGIAQALPASLDELHATLTVAARFAAKHGAEILAAIAESGSEQLRSIVREHSLQQAPDKQRLKELQEIVRRRAGELKLEPEILATRRDLAALAVGSPPGHLRQGWRATELAGLLGSPAPSIQSEKSR
ncbi:MAG TPA: HRDC domain-containing protein [Gammaproteobacteria bacterium]|nr:HRDC domain-containing protein [Gammaproteobacteria bacterium]